MKAMVASPPCNVDVLDATSLIFYAGLIDRVSADRAGILLHVIAPKRHSVPFL